MKMVCSDGLWNTVLKLMCLQQKALRHADVHCSRIDVSLKLGVRREGNIAEWSAKYATGWISTQVSLP